MLPAIIEKLQIQNFRNIENEIIPFGPNINCIFGENGNGKTNILEAIYFLIKRKSFRKNASFPQILGIDGENPEILFSSLFKNVEENKALTFSGKMTSEGSTWHKDGSSTNRKLNIGVIFINPFESHNFHNSASFRRSWIDEQLSQLDEEYKISLSRYTKSLRFRNKLLSTKPMQFQKQIDAIDKEMAPLSLFITNKRLKFLEELKPFVGMAFNELFSEDHELTITLDTKINPNHIESYFELARKNKPKDEILGYTHYGIHKDDYVLLFDGLNSYDYCSLGQQKMSYLSLLFAYIELFRYKFNSFPIVLLDDVSGELDKFRWSRLVEYIKNKNFQVLITTANDNFKNKLDEIEGANKIQVTSGMIKVL
jgi:DNA replication and repair protein RecF